MSFPIGYSYKNKFKLVKIFFDTPSFDRITKDKSAKFVDMLAAVGGSMGLLTGFSIISGVEIVYYFIRYIYHMGMFLNKPNNLWG